MEEREAIGSHPLFYKDMYSCERLQLHSPSLVYCTCKYGVLCVYMCVRVCESV